MSLSEIVQITLEVRKAIIEEVRNTVSESRLPLVFLIGGTGSGKSTTMCFLRGDEMILKDFNYFSKNDHTQSLIGHELATSCTFLPNIEVLEECILVDFPGFEDTNGPLIHLGAELALKALITQYDSKAFVIESITNTDGRYSALENLVGRLKRLFKNPEDFLLGLTKYSQKVGSPKTIKETEETFLRLTPFRQLIPLKDLEDKSHLENYRAILSSPSMQFVQINSSLLLDAEDTSLLKARFGAYLEEMYSQEIDIQPNHYANLVELYQEASNASFLHAINPQLSELFHLPEITPTLIKEFDTKLVDYCLQKYINAIVSINLNMCKNHLKQLEKNSHVLVLEESILSLENYIRRLLGIPDDGDKEWAEYVMQHGKFRETVEELFKLPNWTQNLPFISTEIPNTIYSFARNSDSNEENPPIPLEMLFENCAQEIESLKNTLMIFVQIRNMVHFSQFFEPDKPSEAILDLDPFQRRQVILFKMLMLNRSFKSHHALKTAIQEMLEKANNLEQRGFHQEVTAMQDAVEELIVATEHYMQSPHSKVNYQAFRDATSLTIQNAKTILKKHRDCNYLLANVALAAAGLGIFYGIALVVHRVQTGHWFFFNKTDSVKKLDMIENELRGLCAGNNA